MTLTTERALCRSVVGVLEAGFTEAPLRIRCEGRKARTRPFSPLSLYDVDLRP